MECNRDEAVRARELAEKKMLSKDFAGAKKFVVKAQQLFPDLDGISQMLTVCEVHCANEVKINGLDDWYGMLQLQPTADEASIKKQYRKFALLLHPDKNKYAGAEAAFKLIGEANRVLLDQSKRSLYDLKRNTSAGVIKPKPPTKPANVGSFPNGRQGLNDRNNFYNANFSGMNHDPGHPGMQTTATFWTSCPFCRIRYQYYRAIMNRSLRCQNCLKPFVAYDLSTQVPAGPPPFRPQGKAYSTQSTYPSMHQSSQANVAGGSQVPPAASQHSGAKTDHGGKFSNSGKGAEEDIAGEKVDEVRYEKVKLEEANMRGDHGSKISGAAKKKRNRQVVQSSDSEDGEDAFPGKNANQRRSNRKRQNVTYGDALDDEKIDDEKGAASREHEDMSNGHHNGGDANTSGIDASGKDDPDVRYYPDPEFYEFDQLRSVNLFAVGQVWAIYDDLDGMPRFYGRIKTVSLSGFRVRFTWLEHDTINNSERKWSRKKLPAGSGNFKLGSSQDSEDALMFSHIMAWERGPRKHSYVVRPRKGEIWALLVDWDLKWADEPCVRKSFKYEIVEILSDHTEVSIRVMPLVKVEGFLAVFARPANVPVTFGIDPDERLRFSHMIPSYSLSGNEREGIPAGAFELDQASLPDGFQKLYPSCSFPSGKPGPEVRTTDTNMKCNENSAGFSFSEGDETKASKPEVDVGSKDNQKKYQQQEVDPSFPQVDEMKKACEPEIEVGSKDSRNNTSHDGERDPLSCDEGELKNGSPSLPSQDEVFGYPEPDFHDFGLDRSIDKMQCGQIWALYSDVDGYPKYYALIKSLDLNKGKVYVTWLDGCPSPHMEDEVKWVDKGLPMSCGKFKVLRGKDDSHVYDSLEAFSHLVTAKPAERRNQYQIYPAVGEVWALYREHSAEWEDTNLQNCEHDVVEILQVNDDTIEASPLVKVDDYTCVFEPKQSDGKFDRIVIPRTKMLQFSHLIPAFRLTEEGGGKLQGFWELDPAAVPQLLFCS